MNLKIKEINFSTVLASFFSGQFFTVLKSRYFYYGLLAMGAGISMNFASQTYLHNYLSEGKTLPMLSDMILDRIPFFDISIIYDIFCLVPIALIIIYFFQKKNFNRFPFFLLMIGTFYVVRGIFIVLTPFGNPPMFNGSDPLFHGFANYEIGVYPSGHAGNVFMMLLLVRNTTYRWLIGICLLIVIVALFFAHGHYSIDILSGLFFSYAIHSFGQKHFPMFELSKTEV